MASKTVAEVVEGLEKMAGKEWDDFIALAIPLHRPARRAAAKSRVEGIREAINKIKEASDYGKP
jgi:hypothetical protein